MKSGMRIVDVAVVHTLTQSKINTESNRESTVTDEEASNAESESDHEQDLESKRMEKRMIATESVESFKRRKYANMIRDYGAEFSTAAVETTGGFGKEFRELLDDIAHEAMANESGWEKQEVITGIKHAAAVAIQVGNARVIQENRSRIIRSHTNVIRSATVHKDKAGRRNRNKQKQSVNVLASPASANPSAPCTSISLSSSSSSSHRPATEFLLPSSFSVASAC
jgi:hypothetical protein